jgi:hypothetical protein
MNKGQDMQKKAGATWNVAYPKVKMIPDIKNSIPPGSGLRQAMINRMIRMNDGIMCSRKARNS